MIYKKNCVICNKEFETKRSNKKTCSDACSFKLQRETNKRCSKRYYEKNKDNPEYKEIKNMIAMKYYNENKDDINFRKRERERLKKYRKNQAPDDTKQ